MKRMKKLASMLLAVIMVLGMSMTAFATETSNTEGGNTNEGDTPTTATYTYEIYQIFTGKYNENKTLSEVKWGQNGIEAEGTNVSYAILDELQAVNNDESSDTDKLAVIKKYVNLESDPFVKGEPGQKTFNVPVGYYLVKDVDNTVSGNDSYTLYVVEVSEDGELTINRKVGTPTPDKKIVDDGERVEVNEASIGDDVNYEITGTMPGNIDSYKTYYYKFTDTLSKGLTVKKDSFKVTVNNVDVTEYFYIGVNGEKVDPKNVSDSDDEESGVTTIEVGIVDVKALSLLTDPVVGAITDKTEVVLTYTATLNKDAVIAGDGNPNDVKLTYSNDPNNSGDGSTTPPKNPGEPTTNHPTGESPEKKVVTYTTELTILKKNEENKFLPGTKFTLTGNGVNIVLVTVEEFNVAEDGAYWKLKDGTYTTEAPKPEETDEDGNVTFKSNEADYESTDIRYAKTTKVEAKGTGQTETEVVGTVQDDGTVTFRGLGAGEYTIAETYALPGYNAVSPIEFKLTFEDGTFVSNNDKVTVGEDNMLDTSIVNQKGSLLPSTGGIGTTIFYVVGGILVIGAGILLVAKKRMGRR